MDNTPEKSKVFLKPKELVTEDTLETILPVLVSGQLILDSPKEPEPVSEVDINAE